MKKSFESNGENENKTPIQGLFHPPLGLRNPHTQTIFSSLKIRTLGKKPLDREARQVLVDAGDGVRLLGVYNPQEKGPSRGLILLIHGWEGGSDSTYMLTTGEFFHRRGYDVFRLNLRDHGGTHHLNEGLFNSSLIEESHRAVQRVAATDGNRPFFLVGFSLGGNFAIRMALRHRQDPIPHLRHVFAISPVLDPQKSTEAMDRSVFIYRGYFLKKWKKSLLRKQSLFPHRYKFDDLLESGGLMEITDRILCRYSSYRSPQEYFQTYTLTSLKYSELSVPLLILAAADDPVIPAEDFLKLTGNEHLCVRVERYGGHCGFLRNYRLQAWYEDLIEQNLRRDEEGSKEGARGKI